MSSVSPTFNLKFVGAVVFFSETSTLSPDTLALSLLLATAKNENMQTTANNAITEINFFIGYPLLLILHTAKPTAVSSKNISKTSNVPDKTEKY